MTRRGKQDAKHYIKLNERRRINFMSVRQQFAKKPVRGKKRLQASNRYNTNKKKGKKRGAEADELMSPKNKRERSSDYVD